MTTEFTAVFRRVPEGYIAFVEELPGANTQAATLEEARENLREAVQLVIEANRHLAEEELAGSDAIAQLREQMRSTPEERLRWLEEALEFAARAKRARHRQTALQRRAGPRSGGDGG
jgi:predicted RNase H-like HicB family nuclease